MYTQVETFPTKPRRGWKVERTSCLDTALHVGFPNHPNTNRLKRFSGEENKHTQVLSGVVKMGYGGNYGLDADPNCFYSKP